MRALFAALILAAAPLGATAQTAQPPAPPAQPEASAPAAPAPKPAEPDRAKRLDALFAALKAAPDDESAKEIAARIDVALTPSGSDTADLLMARASQATQAKQFDLAVELLDGLLAIEPDYLEAWNKRATVFFLQEDFSDALVDLRQVVAREPRHYGAWAGIAIICKEIGDDKRALDAARRALAIYPHLDAMKDMEEELAITVEGRPI
ncbi:tetratricopeptide repeat protein [Ancylobacter sp. IITR112]|uniref:tetratricopeptide repeat protein n=1 Tax=Ancylobacter sp. IITR112 TaxID=3138073 RepID=UPI00352A4268